MQPSGRVTLLEPLAVIDGREALFLRDVFGGEVPLSCPYPPLELAFSAALLRQAGIDVEIIPANVLGLRHDAVVRQLAAAPPALVVIPSAWGSLDDDHLLLGMLKADLPDTKLAIFGSNVTAEPLPTLRDSAADFVILGEPEEAILLLAQGKQPGAIPNLAWLEGDELCESERRFPPDWESYPLPARDLLPLERYTVPFARRHPVTTMATTRGCPSACTFCPTHIWHHRTVRARPIPLVMDEIDELVYRYGMREVILRDDTFTWDRDRVLEFCAGLIERNHDLTWRCFATANTVDEELVRTMAEAGCAQICFGFESGDESMLARSGKATTVEQGRNAAHWVHEAGMEVAGTFLVGMEGETAESINRSISFAKATALDYVQVNVATPLPGTSFGRRQNKKGRNSQPRSFRWFGGTTGESDELDPNRLVGEARRFYREFYFRPSYLAGRLRSRRGISVLANHARLSLTMLREVMR
ncbi:MAG: hypothetical protein CMP23_08080 [Rickettsiales bacterium]|nr:hypothetical protein [Rickettsiales bacterium]